MKFNWRVLRTSSNSNESISDPAARNQFQVKSLKFQITKKVSPFLLFQNVIRLTFIESLQSYLRILIDKILVKCINVFKIIEELKLSRQFPLSRIPSKFAIEKLQFILNDYGTNIFTAQKENFREKN